MCLGVVLEEFDTAFSNKFYHSQYDDKSNVNTTAIAAAASILARTLVMLASENTDSPILKSIQVTPLFSQLPLLNRFVLDNLDFFLSDFARYRICKQVNTSLVEELVECFSSTSPGMRCRLVESLMTASQDFASQYVGVFQADPSALPNSTPEIISDTTRFVWNFLADRTSLQREKPPVNCASVCKNPGEVCVGATKSQQGQCRASATRYVNIATESDSDLGSKCILLTFFLLYYQICTCIFSSIKISRILVGTTPFRGWGQDGSSGPSVH